MGLTYLYFLKINKKIARRFITMQTQEDKVVDVEPNADRLADFIMFAQRSFLLDLSKELNQGSISYAQFFLLGYLANEDYLTMTDISKKMGHSTAAATGLVDRLEKLGYVQRLHAADDRRKVMVQITRKGIELVSRLRNIIADSISQVMVAQESGDDEAIQPIYTQLREFLASV
ncbi:MarR family transcriptional regulator [Verrucomicrobiales bacterium]|jgi:DNA-binding MarR family transcriptional regulator|nr:MarR family transcriptional regulator [Verrucomicrobiales bacterium]